MSKMLDDDNHRNNEKPSPERRKKCGRPRDEARAYTASERKQWAKLLTMWKRCLPPVSREALTARLDDADQVVRSILALHAQDIRDVANEQQRHDAGKGDWWLAVAVAAIRAAHALDPKVPRHRYEEYGIKRKGHDQ